MSQEERKLDLSNLPRGAIGIKGLPVSRNARLPSIRSPRDLTLGSQPKRTFTPNIPVRREKKTIESKTTDEKSKETQRLGKSSQKADRGRGRGRGMKSLIQTDGSIFGEGVTIPVESQKDKARESISKIGSSYNRSSIAIKKERLESDISNINTNLDNLLRDDFLDDGEDERESVKPIIFPLQEITKKEEITDNQEIFQNTNLALEMGYDIEKIKKFIKKEKDDKIKTDSIKIVKKEDLPQNEVSKIFTSDKRQMMFLQFPKCVTTQLIDTQQKSTANTENVTSNNADKKSSTSISALPEGCIGKFQILKSGDARIVLGNCIFHLDSINNLHSRHEVVSIQTNSDSGDLSILGNMEHKLSFAPDIDSLLS